MAQLETLFTQAWQRQAKWLWLLLPVSWLYGMVVFLRKQLYHYGCLKSYRAPIPVMVIGNISVGGSGKTPLIISLVHELQRRGVAVGVISRGYGGDTQLMPTLVTEQSLPQAVGDEPCLIVANTQVPMSVCPNRQQAIEKLLSVYPNLQLIIADDGLQHYALQRDIEWIVVDSSRGFGNQQLLPTGFLREPLSRLDGATVIYHITAQSDLQHGDVNDTYYMQLQPSKLYRLLAKKECLDTENLSSSPKNGATVYAVSGIGYPQRFFQSLRQLGYKVIERAFPDHHAFVEDDLLDLSDYPIIITSKDAVKIKVLAQQYSKIAALSIWVLPVSAQLSSPCYDLLFQQLADVGIKVE
ncbi:tetraacyldisaccharide 4'-kinase [Psychrobacter sp. I-STPA6b]|uniref:tetraacyldisaccharide 4'-kinase n=1 Tax=Psychrobacter sp. I-STPA6b TaxID=2585718 RepID=UPI001D0C823C|nr:tetraacyldisaccharide 4'-kinase [Psychrobacter sp. I-STPA6b]